MAEGTETLTSLHPLAWWCWAIALGFSVSGTTNPLLLALIATAVTVVVLLRRSSAPWARSVRAYLLLGAFVIGVRVFFQILVGTASGSTVIFTLPEIPLPEWAAGIRLGGPVTAEAVAYAVYDALRLAVMLWCVGAANALANPRQALRSVPAALYEASVAVVIALSVAPQLIESAQRVHRARRLRGDAVRGLRALGAVALPVLADAIERSMALAAGMEARGFGRTRGLDTRGSLPLMLLASMAATVGAFLLLSTDWYLLSASLLFGGIAGALLGLRLAGRRLRVTHYRPHPWGWRETAVAGCGVAAAAVVLGVGWLDPATLSATANAWLAPAALFPTTDPLVWPDLTPVMLLVAVLAVAPVAITARRRPAAVVQPRHDVRVRALRGQTVAGPVREPEAVR